MMKENMANLLAIKVVPNAKRNMVKEEEGLLKVYLTVPAVEGRANKALIVFLAKYYKIAKKDITIIKGLKSRIKTISILANK